MKVVVEPDLRAGGGRAVDEDPFLAAVGARPRVGCAVVGVQGAGAEVGGGEAVASEVCFADPGALDVREDDGDGVAVGLERVDEGVDVGGGLLRGGAVVVDYLRGGVSGDILLLEVVFAGGGG